MVCLELTILSLLTRKLPPVRGAGVLANLLARVYNRKKRDSVKVAVNGFSFCVNPRESVCEKSLAFYPQLYDRVEFKYLRRTLKPSNTFVDVGAHVGAYALEAARLIGRAGQVVAVEAAPNTFCKLVRNIDLNPDIAVLPYNLGVADKRGTKSLGIKPGNSGGNSFVMDFQERVDVVCVTLLDIINRAAINHLTGIKLDIEGFEYKVLKRFFAEAPAELWPTFFIVERNPKYMDEADPVKLLEGRGYAVRFRNGLNHILETR